MVSLQSKSLSSPSCPHRAWELMRTDRRCTDTYFRTCGRRAARILVGAIQPHQDFPQLKLFQDHDVMARKICVPDEERGSGERSDATPTRYTLVPAGSVLCFG